MQPYETTIMHRLLKHDPELRARYQAAAAQLKSERKLTPPGSGNVRVLKKTAEKDAMAALYQELGREPSAGRKYDVLYARSKGIMTSN